MSNFTDYLDTDKINIYTNSDNDVVIDIRDPDGIVLNRQEVRAIITALQKAGG